MEITQQELGTYRPITNLPLINIPDIGSRVRILSCVDNRIPITSFTLYEGTVLNTIHNPAVFSNQITLHQGATEFVVIDRVNTVNGPAPLINGIIRFPFDLGDFNLYYWKYIYPPTEFNKEKIKRPFIPESEIITLEKNPFEQTAKRRLLFAGKRTKRNKKPKVKRRKSLK
jgi:hypothetical protein